MDNATLEMIEVAETVKAAEVADIFALSLDDLDLVAGGTTPGVSL